LEGYIPSNIAGTLGGDLRTDKDFPQILLRAAIASQMKNENAPKETKGLRIAVIGSGLAGLTTAYLLRMEGVEVYLLERVCLRLLRGVEGFLLIMYSLKSWDFTRLPLTSLCKGKARVVKGRSQSGTEDGWSTFLCARSRVVS
jgi:hypothetical protein